MKKRIIFMITLSFIFLAGCDVEELTFHGEVETWKGKMKVKHSDTYQEIDFELFYTDEDAKSVGEIEFLVEYNAGKFGSEQVFLDKNKRLLSGSSCNSCAFLTTTSDITVTIEWDGKTEVMYLE